MYQRIKSFLVGIAICSCCIQYNANAQSLADTLHDRDGNNYSIQTMPDNKKWMTTNLNINIPASYGYDSAGQKKLYGRLYTWESAQEGCKLLGDGWCLPTSEDWQQLAKYYAGVTEDSVESRKNAYKALLSGGSALFNVQLGGGRDFDGK